MDLSFTPEQEELQARARAWLGGEQIPSLPSDLDASFAVQREWQARLYQAGWIGLGWPSEYGGRGGAFLEQLIFNRELSRIGAPLPAGVIGLDIVGPTILEYGTEEQKRRYIPALLDGSEIWCQGFSEPDAGSDLASLRTRGEVRDETIVVTGQKVWTSWAQYSRWCAVLARTDEEAPRHQGISFVLVDLESEGITVQPLVQMTGDAEFSEVFFDGVEVPAENVLGGLNNGWKMAMATLGHERGPFATRRQIELRIALDEIVRDAQRIVRGGGWATDDPVVRRRIGRCEALVETLAAQCLRTVDRITNDGPVEESSIDKLLLTEVEQEVFSLAFDLLGPNCTIPETTAEGVDADRWIRGYLYSRGASIYGGTSEIQRTIVAQRVLGLGRA
jgi:alkylation response protein AidB-like acyl-CoA dehydrogenase